MILLPLWLFRLTSSTCILCDAAAVKRLAFGSSCDRSGIESGWSGQLWQCDRKEWRGWIEEDNWERHRHSGVESGWSEDREAIRQWTWPMWICRLHASCCPQVFTIAPYVFFNDSVHCLLLLPVMNSIQLNNWGGQKTESPAYRQLQAAVWGHMWHLLGSVSAMVGTKASDANTVFCTSQSEWAGEGWEGTWVKLAIEPQWSDSIFLYHRFCIGTPSYNLDG